MRLYLALAAALAATLPLADDARAENWADHIEVKAENDGGKVTVTFEGKTDWYFNTEYNAKVELSAPDGVTLGKDKLRKDDASFEGQKEGKAKKATFETSASEDKPVEVEYKIVVCSADNCSPPFKGTITAK